MTPAEAKVALEANRRKAAASGSLTRVLLLGFSYSFVNTSAGGVTAAKAVIYKDEKQEEAFDPSKVDPLALAMLGVEYSVLRDRDAGLLTGENEQAEAERSVGCASAIYILFVRATLVR
eukprot:1178184-Prorocentrum_minimum.AAC.1